ncbi:hypothetical protein ACFE04_008617 [Oxalis oulophora]
MEIEGERKIVFGKYDMGRLLGKGTFAKVYHAKHLISGESVAIKVINKAFVKKEGLMDQIKREISVMSLIKHPNVVELKEVMATKTNIFFVMEYVRGGELFAKVAKGKLKEDLARKYFQQLITALDYCHSRGVSHRDLKPENLLLDHNGDLKISDFGLSALPAQLLTDGLLHTQCGTPAYVAPEVLRKKGYHGSQTDIWSCGVILYVLLAGFLPFQDDNLINMYNKIFKLTNTTPEDNNNNNTSSLTCAHNLSSPKFFNAFQLISSMSSGNCEGRKGQLSVTAEVFEVAPELAFVEFSKSSGDTFEYAKFCEEDVRPGLKDIVWIWQGDNNSEGFKFNRIYTSVNVSIEPRSHDPFGNKRTLDRV